MWRLRGTLIFRNKGKPPKGGQYLRCQNAILNNGCKRPAWRYSEFENAFYTFVQEVSFADVLNEDGTKSKATNLQIQKSAAKEKLTDLSKQYDTIIDRLVEPSLSTVVLASLDKRAASTAAEMEKLKAEIT